MGIHQECSKIVLAFFALLAIGEIGSWKNWSLGNSFSVALLPALLYGIQNLCTAAAYQNLDGLMFNLLNNTKYIWNAMWLFVLLGKRQSTIQIFALFVLSGVAVMVSLDNHKGGDSKKQNNTTGIMFILAASTISGLAGALVQRASQTGKVPRNAFMLTTELAVYQILTMGVKIFVESQILGYGEGMEIMKLGLYHGFHATAMIPILLNAVGGITVGLIYKYVGGLLKGYALIFGLIISGVVRSYIEGLPLTPTLFVGLGLTVASLYLWISYPTTTVRKKKE